MFSLLFFAGLLILGGAVAGFMAGLFGVGGGAILVPVIYEVLGLAGVDDTIRTHMALATSLAVVFPNGIRSTIAHNAKGSVDWKIVKLFTPSIIIGVFLGTIIAKQIDGNQLRLIYGIMSIAVAGYLFWSRQNPDFRFSWPSDWITRVYGVITGILSTLMGIGGGTFTSSYMTSFGRSIHQAVATAAAIGPVVALPAIIGFIWIGLNNELLPVGSVGFISLLGVGLILPTSLLAVPLGVKFAHSLSRAQLELLFIIFLLTVGLRFIWSVIF